jgi:hypothetical protein
MVKMIEIELKSGWIFQTTKLRFEFYIELHGPLPHCYTSCNQQICSNFFKILVLFYNKLLKLIKYFLIKQGLRTA